MSEYRPLGAGDTLPLREPLVAARDEPRLRDLAGRDSSLRKYIVTQEPAAKRFGRLLSRARTANAFCSFSAAARRRSRESWRIGKGLIRRVEYPSVPLRPLPAPSEISRVPLPAVWSAPQKFTTRGSLSAPEGHRKRASVHRLRKHTASTLIFASRCFSLGSSA
jgi:hypothetical protein